MMMLRLSQQTVRHSWQPYAGALVALSFGGALLTVAVTIGAGVEETVRHAGLNAADRSQLSGMSSLFGIMAAIALFMATFVVGSTFGFTICRCAAPKNYRRSPVRWSKAGETI